MSEKSDKLPKIQEDPDTGRRYVMVGKKRIWLAKGVTKKTLLKFLLKLRKKIKKATMKKRRSTTKKKEIKPAVFGENVARSLIGDPTFNIASRALSLASQGKPPSDKKELEELQKKLDKLLESKKEEEPKKEDKLVVPEKGKVGERVYSEREVRKGVDRFGKVLKSKEAEVAAAEKA